MAKQYFSENGVTKVCEGHKYVHKSTTSYWRRTARFAKEYVMIDTYFCERCLHEEEKKKRVELRDAEEHKLPDWARTITTHAQDAEYSW